MAQYIHWDNAPIDDMDDEARQQQSDSEDMDE